jgi:hypothetical protein
VIDWQLWQVKDLDLSCLYASRSTRNGHKFLIRGHLFPSKTSDKEQRMLTRAKPFSLAMAALLVLTLVPGAPIGHAQNKPFGKLRTGRGDHHQ